MVARYFNSIDTLLLAGGELLLLYHRTLEQAMEYIEQHLKQAMKVEDVANHVNISYFHFHRVFFVATGEVLGDYIRKRRLTQAACELLNTNYRILDIALEYQFESQEAFSRSFKAMFGIMPGRFRKKGLQPYLSKKENITGKRLHHRIHQISIQPTIVYLANPILIGGIQGKTAISNNQIPMLWSTFIDRLNELKNPYNPNVFYGVSIIEGIDASYIFTEDAEYIEVVGTEVRNCDDIPLGMVTYEIPAGYYAVFEHKGKAEDMVDTYKYIMGTWTYNTDYELNVGYSFERYGEDYAGPENAASIARIYIPIKTPKNEV